MEVNPDLEKNLKGDPVRFFQINILHYCSTDQMKQLLTWLKTYDYDVICDIQIISPAVSLLFDRQIRLDKINDEGGI